MRSVSTIDNIALVITICEIMSSFENFTKMGVTHSLEIIGEAASIGGNQFLAIFEESAMDITSHVFGDEDEITTVSTCLKSALSKPPRINQTLIRVNGPITYVITEVESDIASYRITLRAKNG